MANVGANSTVLPPGQLPVLPAVDNTLGALLVGGLVATALWGVTCVQTFSFFLRVGADPTRRLQKSLVAILWVLDTFDTVLNGHILYFYLITNYFAPQTILFPVWSVIIHVAATSISNFIVRSVFARRVYRLSKGNIPGTLLIVALSTLDLICGITITAKAFGITSYLQLAGLSNLMYLNFAAGTGSDIAVALALCYLLHKSRTGFKRTDSLIRVLMAYTINTGLLVALDATAGMFTYAFMPNNFIFLGCYLLLSKLYLNSYLAILNARNGLGLRGTASDGPVSVDIHLSQISGVRWRTATSATSGYGYNPESHPESSGTALGTDDLQPALVIPKIVDVQSSGVSSSLETDSRRELQERDPEKHQEPWSPV
ncbi:hypothetical protein MIND_00593800 [Mycena indigotica]|uniref:DUF6534 domain-containing protein n=1 Tax=Mycena indigotica TaxID=2126181 RepID=A0A8H6SRD6_9AGAR|nr:uncharacterized protein MIND_00593800 [Mycena indigotica]KAF7303645.1 hypothetical protein MIND_00593800 [Mycena indigotica]